MSTKHISKTITLHGVFLEILNQGVILMGTSGIGKSEVALSLINRGYKLIADDAVTLTKKSENLIIGSSEPLLKNFLEVRGLGILNIRKMFGAKAIKDSHKLTLIVKIKHFDLIELQNMDRLKGIYKDIEILGTLIPEVTIPVSPGRHLAVLVECAVRNQILKQTGYNASEHFMTKQAQCLQLQREQDEC